MSGIEASRDFITKNISPINTAFFFTTGILVPLLDLVKPVAPLLKYVAVVAMIGFVVLLIVKLLGRPRPIPATLVATAGICATIFAAGAYASSTHVSGFIASKDPAIAHVQASILGIQEQTAEINRKLDSQSELLSDIRSGKSDDPRVALKNMGVNWTYADFMAASKVGDLKTLELFLQGGMPTRIAGYDFSLPAVAVEGNYPKIVSQLKLFRKYGFELKAKNSVSSFDSIEFPPNLYALAREKKNSDAAAYLLENGFSVADYDGWKKEYAERHRDTTPNVYKF